MSAVYRQIERPYLWLQHHLERFSPSLLIAMALTAAFLALVFFSAGIATATDGEIIAAAICAAGFAGAISAALRWGAIARTVLWARRHLGSPKAICGGRENGPWLTTSARVLVAGEDGIAEISGRVLRPPEVLWRAPYPEVTHFRVIFDEIEVHTTANETRSWAGIPPAQSAEFASVVEPRVV